MLPLLRNLARNLPTFLLAFLLAVAAWISAVTASDPTEERVYPRAVPLELIGQDPGLLLVNEVPSQVSLTLSAPRSIWDKLTNEQISVQAKADLSSLGPGEHTIPVQITIGIRPVEIVSYTPRTLNITLEALATKILPIHLVERGDLAIGYQGGPTTLDPTNATVTGRESLVNRIQEIRANLDLNGAKENINRLLNLFAVDASEVVVSGVTITPDRVNVSKEISQRGGYRNVVVKVMVAGQVASGYRVTNISVFPPTVTVFSADPRLVDNLPGYIETTTFDLTNIKDDQEVFLRLNLPPGVSLVGLEEVQVQVGIAAIEGSVTLTNMPVQVIGLDPSLDASLSPDRIDVILSGPLPVLDQLTARDVRVVVDLTGKTSGTYQITPRVEFNIPELRVESILPGSIEVTLVEKPQETMTPTINPSKTVTPQPNPTPTPTK